MDPNGPLSNNVCQTHMKSINGFTEMSPICLPSKRKRNDGNNFNGNEEDGPKVFPSKESLKKRKYDSLSLT